MRQNIFPSGNENVKKILNYIHSANLSVGERLPAERELAAALGISRNSLREALKTLQALGVLEILRGSGIYLKKEEITPYGDSAKWLFSHKGDIMNMITVREALDLRAIELIPEEEYDDVRVLLKASVKEARQGQMDSVKLLNNDLEFHNYIRKASGNDILLNICVALTGNIYDERTVLFSDKQRIEQSLMEHNAIANAFGTGDVNEVKQAYIAHLVSVRRSIEDGIVE